MTDVWFNGPVAEAVHTVAQKNLVFLVVIYDDSDQSKQLFTTLDNEKLTVVMKQKTIALKMQKDSKEAIMFGQLYPISQVPVVYFILQGTIKDFGTEDLTSDKIILKINTLYPNKQPRQENKVPREEKLVNDQVQQQRQQQNKAYLEKMKKEKKADEEYKRKVKEQIAIDRASRKADGKATSHNPTSDANGSTILINHDCSNLNIKQLDGTSLRHSFSSSDTLGRVSQWIDSNRTDGDIPFKLFAQFPNRNFDIGDEQRRLIELKLCPSATLIMKPIKNATSAYNASATKTNGWLDYIYSAGDVVYNSVSSAASFLVTPSNAPEPGQRLGGSGSIGSGSGSHVNTLNSAKYKKDDDERQTYNGNSVNQE